MRRAIAEPDQFHLHGFGVAVLQAVLRVFLLKGICESGFDLTANVFQRSGRRASHIDKKRALPASLTFRRRSAGTYTDRVCGSFRFFVQVVRSLQIGNHFNGPVHRH